MTCEFGDLLRRLRAYRRPGVTRPSPEERQAAVLIVLYEGNAGPSLILTRRSHRLSSHAGQIALPGGTVEPEDATLEDTALREADEEIALPPESVELLCRLSTQRLPSGYHVTPVVATAAKLPVLRAAPDEVDEIIPVPLSFLMNEACFCQGSMLINGVKREFYYFDYKGHYVWGATAAMLKELALIVTRDVGNL